MVTGYLETIANKRLADTNLTVQELLDAVEQLVNERLTTVQPPRSDINNSLPSDWWQSMIDDLIVPVSSTTSVTEMLQEERDQWYKPL